MKKVLNNIKSIRLLTGCKNMWNKKLKIIIPLIFLISTYFCWYAVTDNISNIGFAPLEFFLLCVVSFLTIAITVIGTLLIISMIGTPLSAKRVERCLASVGFKDKAGETPLLLSRFKEAKADVFEFFSPTIPINEYEKKSADIETALNVHIVSIDLGKDCQHVYLKTVSANKELPDKIDWDNSLLFEKDSVLLLGESQLDTVTVSLSVNPHILIGGSTGSGKSVFLKLILMQCIKKNYDVYIADFKGGWTLMACGNEKVK